MAEWGQVYNLGEILRTMAALDAASTKDYAMQQDMATRKLFASGGEPDEIERRLWATNPDVASKFGQLQSNRASRALDRSKIFKDMASDLFRKGELSGLTGDALKKYVLSGQEAYAAPYAAMGLGEYQPMTYEQVEAWSSPDPAKMAQREEYLKTLGGGAARNLYPDLPAGQRMTGPGGSAETIPGANVEAPWEQRAAEAQIRGMQQGTQHEYQMEEQRAARFPQLYKMRMEEQDRYVLTNRLLGDAQDFLNLQAATGRTGPLNSSEFVKLVNRAKPGSTKTVTIDGQPTQLTEGQVFQLLEANASELVTQAIALYRASGNAGVFTNKDFENASQTQAGILNSPEVNRQLLTKSIRYLSQQAEQSQARLDDIDKRMNGAQKTPSARPASGSPGAGRRYVRRQDGSILDTQSGQVWRKP